MADRGTLSTPPGDPRDRVYQPCFYSNTAAKACDGTCGCPSCPVVVARRDHPERIVKADA